MADRQYPRNLGVSTDQLRRGVQPGDARKEESELQEIFTNISYADPTQPGTQKDGNFSRNRIRITTPAVANTELPVAHGLGRVPVGVDQTLPGISGGGIVRIRFSKAWDIQYVYLKFPDAIDAGVVVSLTVW